MITLPAEVFGIVRGKSVALLLLVVVSAAAIVAYLASRPRLPEIHLLGLSFDHENRTYLQIGRICLART